MPLYYFRCKACGAPARRIIEPEKVKDVRCPKCGGEVERTPKPPTAMLKEVVDNGLMVKRLENFTDGQELTKARSKLDLSRPDWQKTEES